MSTLSSTPALPIDPKIREKQLLASSPSSSAWVSANAGSGKTYVLVQRVVRLLLGGCDPSRILCLTFTKAAAGEMANRVFSTLGSWTSLDDTELSSKIEDLEGEIPDATKLYLARTLFARALETPGGLKIQTIHAFCESLLHQFPLEADISGRFAVIDDREQLLLLDRARQQVLHQISQGKDSKLISSYNHLVSYASESALSEIIVELMSRREELEIWLSSLGGVKNFESHAREMLDFSATDTIESLQEDLLSSSPLSESHWQELHKFASEDSGVNSQKLASKVESYLSSKDNSVRLIHLQDILFTQSGDIRSFRTYPSKSVDAMLPQIREQMSETAQSLLQGLLRLKTLKQIVATHHLFIFGTKITDNYRRLKRLSGSLDFDDLVARVVDLLKRKDACAWVLYRLDPSLDHILLDEAQDTNPRQWDIVNELTQEFFAGLGSRESSPRSLFVVGDEKQSIYSFQGVRPETFSSQHSRLSSDVSLETVNLNQSFRSSRLVLESVDRVFSDPANARGLGTDAESLHHHPHRSDMGSVEVWDLFPQSESEKIDFWNTAISAEDYIRQSPAISLAQSVASRIKHWITEQRPITTKDGVRPVHAGDFLILVRMRDEFFSALVRELKNNNIPVSGEDRLVLSRHIAVQDLLALGRVLVTPQDNLSLAGLLKSPLFNFTEDDIATLCISRDKKSVWQVLGESKNKKFKESYDCLQVWRVWASDLPVYEFYARVLSEGGGRRAFYSRLGQESQDILNSFLDMAIDYGKSGLTGLLNFLEDMDSESTEIKREWSEQHDQVRIMSVHGAKGLEAPVVFVVDKSGPRGSSSKVRLHEWQDGSDNLYLWSPSTGDDGDISKSVKEKLRKDSDDEYRRLLYVAMTRARDHLIVCGYKSGSGESEDTWHNMVSGTLSDELQQGGSLSSSQDIYVRHWRLSDSELVKDKLPDASPETSPSTRHPLPSWLTSPAPLSSLSVVPLNPSGVGRESKEGSDIYSILDSDKTRNSARDRGNAVHKLLELLPNLSSEQRWDKASLWLETNLPDFSSDARLNLLDSVRAILENPLYSPYFASDISRSEVSLTGEIEHAGIRLPVEGIVDRLAVLEDEVVVIDYKSNRIVPSDESEVSHQYGAQMALYRSLLDTLYPSHAKRFVLLWTSALSGEQWMELSSKVLDGHLDRLVVSA